MIKGEFRNCKICGKEFYLYPSRVRRRTGKYCSLLCYQNNRNGRVQIKCPICGIKFNSFRSDNRKTCSRKCANKLRSIKLKGRNITWRDKISRANKGRPNFKLRERKLSLSHRVKIGLAHKGEKCHFWKGGVSKANCSLRKNIQETISYKDWRSAVFKRDNYTCQECGHQGKGLVAHHIVSFAQIIKDYNIKCLDDALKSKELWSLDNGKTLCAACHKLKHKRLTS